MAALVGVAVGSAVAAVGTAALSNCLCLGGTATVLVQASYEKTPSGKPKPAPFSNVACRCRASGWWFRASRRISLMGDVLVLGRKPDQAEQAILLRETEAEAKETAVRVTSQGKLIFQFWLKNSEAASEWASALKGASGMFTAVPKALSLQRVLVGQLRAKVESTEEEIANQREQIAELTEGLKPEPTTPKKASRVLERKALGSLDDVVLGTAVEVEKAAQVPGVVDVQALVQKELAWRDAGIETQKEPEEPEPDFLRFLLTHQRLAIATARERLRGSLGGSLAGTAPPPSTPKKRSPATATKNRGEPGSPTSPKSPTTTPAQRLRLSQRRAQSPTTRTTVLPPPAPQSYARKAAATSPLGRARPRAPSGSLLGAQA